MTEDGDAVVDATASWWGVGACAPMGSLTAALFDSEHNLKNIVALDPVDQHPAEFTNDLPKQAMLGSSKPQDNGEEAIPSIKIVANNNEYSTQSLIKEDKSHTLRLATENSHKEEKKIGKIEHQ